MDRTRLPPPRWATPVGLPSSREIGPTSDRDQQESVRRVAAIQQRLPVTDRRLITLYVQEGGNYSAVARRLGRDSDGIRDRYHRLFRRIRAATA
jgi:DNA-directed RNA polymerase specialized sigma24 family protein